MSASLFLSAALATVCVHYARADSYLMGGTEPVCWRTDTAAKTGAMMLNPCPKGITFFYQEAPPTEMFDDKTYSVKLLLDVDPLLFPFTLSDTKIIPKECKDACKDCKDACLACPAGFACTVRKDHLPHVNVHSCLQTSGACTPFIANTPGLATHTPAQKSSFDGNGRANFTMDVALDAHRYMIIGHARFFVGKIKYDVANGVAREILRAKVVIEEWEPGNAHYIVLPLGFIVALLFVGGVAWGKEEALEAVLAMLRDSVSLFMSLAFEFLDIISDGIVFISIWSLPASSTNADTGEVYSNADKKKYLIWYGFFMLAGLLIFLVHTTNNFGYIFMMFSSAVESDLEVLKHAVKQREKKLRSKRGRKSSPITRTKSGRDTKKNKGYGPGGKITPILQDVEDQDKPVNLSGIEKIELISKFLVVSQDTAVLELEINRCMGLVALLIFEDIPMLCLNIAYANEHGAILEILMSLMISSMMVAFKISAIWTLRTLKENVELRHRETMALLEALEERAA